MPIYDDLRVTTQYLNLENILIWNTERLGRMIQKIHSNVNEKLITALHEAGDSARELARRRGVNILYVLQLLKDGIEPTDKTESGRRVREKLFMPRWKKNQCKRKLLPGEAHIKKQIAKMARQTRVSLGLQK